jgi:hypothetical protein
MINFIRKSLVLICSFVFFAPVYTTAHDGDSSPKMADVSFEEQNPSAAALAHVGFSNPFICSALMSTMICMTYNLLAKKHPTCDILNAGFLLSTFLGWPVIFRVCHQYLMNTHIVHEKTEWCTDRCENFDDGTQSCTIIQQIITVAPPQDDDEEEASQSDDKPNEEDSHIAENDSPVNN